MHTHAHAPARTNVRAQPNTHSQITTMASTQKNFFFLYSYSNIVRGRAQVLPIQVAESKF